MEYRNATFAFKELNYKRRRKIGKCPLTPHEVSGAARACNDCLRCEATQVSGVPSRLAR